MDNSQNKPKKTERACKPCRDLKVRCLPCPRGGDICQKCQRSGASCIFEELKPRKKRKAPNVQTTVEALEAKVAELAKQLEENNPQRHVGLDREISTFSSTRGPSSDDSGSHAALLAPSPSSNIELAGSDGNEHIIEQMFRCCILTTSTANAYLLKYRQMCEYSPFAVIPEGATVGSLRQNQPFLFHAILAVTSRENQGLQSMLDRSLHEGLMRRVMIEGEKSIDLLQAFLVYLAWEHFFYVPKRRRFNQMLSVANSMCVDMGLDIGPSEASARRFGLELEHHYSADGVRDEIFFSKAARRAYIGCFYVSSTSAWAWARPNNIHCTDYMMQCARSLSIDPELETDSLILPLLQIQKTGDEFHNILLPANLDYSGPCSSEQTQNQLRMFRNKMDEVLSDVNLECIPMNLAAHSASSHAHEMGILTESLSNKHRPSGQEKRVSTSSSQLDVLTSCFDSSKAFVESFLSLPLSEYPKLSVTQWWGLMRSIFVLYMLLIGMPELPLWDVCAAREKVKIEIYLDLLCYRMQSITGSSPEAPAGRDLYSLMGPIFANVKSTYERLKKLPQASSSADREPVHGTEIFKDQAKVRPNKLPKTTSRSRCPAFPFWSGTENSTAPSVEACSDQPSLFEPADIDGAVQDESSWLECMPSINLDPNLSNWNFDIT